MPNGKKHRSGSTQSEIIKRLTAEASDWRKTALQLQRDLKSYSTREAYNALPAEEKESLERRITSVGDDRPIHAHEVIFNCGHKEIFLGGNVPSAGAVVECSRCIDEYCYEHNLVRRVLWRLPDEEE